MWLALRCKFPCKQEDNGTRQPTLSLLLSLPSQKAKLHAALQEKNRLNLELITHHLKASKYDQVRNSHMYCASMHWKYTHRKMKEISEWAWYDLFFLYQRCRKRNAHTVALRKRSSQTTELVHLVRSIYQIDFQILTVLSHNCFVFFMFCFQLYNCSWAIVLQGFWRSVFHWTLASFSLTFSPVLVPGWFHSLISLGQSTKENNTYTRQKWSQWKNGY